MSDVLIRDVPDEVLVAIDARAAALGLSRAAYLRRRLVQEAQSGDITVARADLAWFAEGFADLDDDDVMARAWE